MFNPKEYYELIVYLVYESEYGTYLTTKLMTH